MKLEIFLTLLIQLVSSATRETYHINIPNEMKQYLVIMKDEINVNSIDSYYNQDLVYDQMDSLARTSLKLLKSKIRVRKLNTKLLKQIKIANAFVVSMDDRSKDILENDSDVLEVVLDKTFKVDLEEQDVDRVQYARADVEWNVKYIGAPKVWGSNVKGKGFVFASADTGVHWSHPALKNNYRGYSIDGVQHDYNWYDAINEPFGTGQVICPINSPEPCDDSGHGTHTTSTATGLHGIGVAPEAKWIACRNMDRGYGRTSTYLACLEFFLAPHDKYGKNPRRDLRPHVIGNSYGCSNSEGCALNAFSRAIRIIRAAGIFMSVSAGNEGPSCGSIDSPPGYEPMVMSVGATEFQSDDIASFSSRGPVNMLGLKNYTKPDISAPGVFIKGAYPKDGYTSFSGTSMASPHVSGAVMLISQACPWLSRRVDMLEYYISSTAKGLKSADQYCGLDGPSSIPNNVFGFGLIQVHKAVQKCQTDLLER